MFPGQTPSNPPAFNVPLPLLIILGLLVLAHGLRVMLPDEEQFGIILRYALIPARYSPPENDIYLILPGGLAADMWTFVTHTFLHANWTHLLMNGFWMLAFGAPVARRFGAWRFVSFYFVCGIAGGLAHVVTHAGDIYPVVGASGAISGLMGGATRFVFLAGGPLGGLVGGRDFRPEAPSAQASLVAALSEPRAIIFIGIWIGLNILFGATGLTVTGETAMIAWEAHLGGFVAGLVLFGLFDPVRRSPSGGPGKVGYGEWGGGP